MNCDTDLGMLDADKFIKFSECINERDVIGGPKVIDDKNFLVVGSAAPNTLGAREHILFAAKLVLP